MSNTASIQVTPNSALTISTVPDPSGTFETVTISGTAPSAPPPPPPTAPTLPTATVIGTPAARMICWGGPEWLSSGQNGLNTQKANGWGGYEITEGSPAAPTASQVAPSNTAGLESYLGLYYITQSAATLGALAGAVKAAGMTGMAFDSEQADWSGSTATAYSNGQAIAQAMWGAFPAMTLLYYHYYPPGGWNDAYYASVGDGPYPHAAYAQDSFFQGLLAGMQAAGATGRIVLLDATFYRDAGIWIPGATNQAAYFLNSQAVRALLSYTAPAALWSYACDHFDIAGFTWRGTDGTGFYDDNEPGDTEWVQSIKDARAYSEGPRRAEYVWNSAWPPVPSIPSGTPTFSYGSATNLAGMQAAAATTPLATASPTITAATATASTSTVACTAAHAYGIRAVKVYNGTTFSAANPAASYLGAMQMTFQANGGSYTGGYPNAAQACKFTTPASVGQWFVLEAISIKDDTAWFAVQAA